MMTAGQRNDALSSVLLVENRSEYEYMDFPWMSVSSRAVTGRGVVGQKLKPNEANMYHAFLPVIQ